MREEAEGEGQVYKVRETKCMYRIVVSQENQFDLLRMKFSILFLSKYNIHGISMEFPMGLVFFLRNLVL